MCLLSLTPIKKWPNHGCAKFLLIMPAVVVQVALGAIYGNNYDKPSNMSSAGLIETLTADIIL